MNAKDVVKVMQIAESKGWDATPFLTEMGALCDLITAKTKADKSGLHRQRMPGKAEIVAAIFYTQAKVGQGGKPDVKALKKVVEFTRELQIELWPVKPTETPAPVEPAATLEALKTGIVYPLPQAAKAAKKAKKAAKTAEAPVEVVAPVEPEAPVEVQVDAETKVE